MLLLLTVHFWTIFLLSLSGRHIFGKYSFCPFLDQTFRETIKNYFADFVPKGGSPPPFTDFSPKIFLQKGLKMVFFAQKTPDFGPKNRLRIWGVPLPSPLRTYDGKDTIYLLSQSTFWRTGFPSCKASSPPLTK